MKKKKKPTKKDGIDWFMSKTKLTKSGCWFWTSVYGTNPCLRAKIGGWYKDKYDFVSSQASRTAYALLKKDFNPDLLVLHNDKCPADTSYKCVNPDHLYQGTRKDNSRDAYAFGNALQGKEHPNAQFTTKEIKQIRKWWNAGHSRKEIAIKLGWPIPAKWSNSEYWLICRRINFALIGWKSVKYPITRPVSKRRK